MARRASRTSSDFLAGSTRAPSFVARRGFTIVELLIVVVVIAILAAITIVAYNGIQNRAKESAAQAAAKQAFTKIQAYAIANGDLYPADLATAGLVNSNYQYRVDNAASPKTFCLTATSSNVSFFVSSVVSTPTAGACAGHGINGGGVITNLALNPTAELNASWYNPWGGNGGGVVSLTRVSAAWASSGYAARATWTTGNTTWNGDNGYTTPSHGGAGSLQPNTQYTAVWKAATSKSQRLLTYVGNWRQLNSGVSDGSGTVQTQSGQVLASAGVPVQQFITFTTGPNTYGAKIFAQLVNGTGASLWSSGDYLDMSDLMIVEGAAVPTFADGDSPGWIWNGTPNNSTSTGPQL